MSATTSNDDRNNSERTPVFSVGPKAQREVRGALRRSNNPAEVIANYQQTRSLHSMFAKAFETTPHYLAETTGDDDVVVVEKDRRRPQVESLDTDSVLNFLGHLGVSKYEVHKRISDALQKQLEDELRKTTSTEPSLLLLLQNCWPYATVNPEFRPILWSVLKQLGDQTPLEVLKKLAERDASTGQLKHTEIFKPLPPLLKRLVWEADWTDKVPAEVENGSDTKPKQYLKLVQSTLLFETVNPLIQSYTSTSALVDASSKFFVMSTLERKVSTTQRRALTAASSAAASSVSGAGTGAVTATASSLLSKTGATTSISTAAGGATGTSTSTSTPEPFLQSGKAVSQIRNYLSDTSRGSASYRPQLLHAILSVLMAQHGAQVISASTDTSHGLLAGPSHLHCTLVADILLSTSGPLPKQYGNVHALARTLDDAVRRGVLTDVDLIEIQRIFRLIYQAEPCEDLTDGDNDGDNDGEDNMGTGDAKTKADRNKITIGKTRVNSKFGGEDEDNDHSGGGGRAGSSGKNKTIPNKSLMRQLNQFITAGLTSMKESDPQSLFLNPVTDEIAPNYSDLIKKPMCITKMQGKIKRNRYHSIEDWEADVRLMFQNCIVYNSEESGQWFRGEANRQLKVFTDEILPQAKKLYAVEVQKRNREEFVADEVKRKRETDEEEKPKIVPLDPARKKRKVELQEYSLSMPALAVMLLADPFVVRLLLDRVFRSLRIDVLKGSGVPVHHMVVPSIMQLLFLAQWSPQICAVRGHRFVVPDAGLQRPKTMDTVEALVPYTSLSRYLPILIHLLLDAELDKRLAVGGELHTVAQSSLPRSEPLPITIAEDSPPSQVALALFEGAFVFVCLPGNSLDVSLSVTFAKFSTAFQELANGNVWDERSFFKCLIPSILRHKSKLNKAVRDVIVSTWIDWLKGPANEQANEERSTRRRKKKVGSVTSAAHEYLLILLNEWASSFGNVLMPRDLLVKVATEVTTVVNATETSPERKLAALWKTDNDEKEFAPIKVQYERLLTLLPDSRKIQWKESAGIESEKGDGAAEDEILNQDETADAEMALA